MNEYSNHYYVDLVRYSCMDLVVVESVVNELTLSIGESTINMFMIDFNARPPTNTVTTTEILELT